MKRFLILLIFLFAISGYCKSREIVEEGKFELFLNGVKKGEEKYKIAIDKKDDIYELFSELRFQYPYPQSKRGYVDMKVYPYYYAVNSTGEFLKYEYRSKIEDFSKTDLVETERSATELIDQDTRITTVFNQEAQRTDDIMNDRIDLGVNAGYLLKAGKVLRFSQTRMSFEKRKDEPVADNLIILEPYGFCLYRLLIDKLKGDGPKWQFNLAVPQLLRLKPCTIEYEGTLKTFVAGQNYILKHFNILIKERIYTSFWVDKKNNIVMVTVPTEGVTAVRADYQIEPYDVEDVRITKETIEIKSGKFTEEDVLCPSGDSNINGSLMLPLGKGPFPVVLLVQDYSHLDKDGNLPFEDRKASTLKQLAVILAENGIASLRYPSKGLNKSDSDNSLLTLEGRALEVSNLISYLNKRDDVDKDRIYTLSIGFGGLSVLKEIDKLTLKGAIFVALPMKPIVRVWKEQVSSMQNIEYRQEAYIELDNLLYELQKKEAKEGNFKGMKVSLDFIRELQDVNITELLEKIKCDALFLYPERDNVIFAYHSEILEKETLGKRKGVYLKGVGHTLSEVNSEGIQSGIVKKDALTPIFDFILKEEKK